MKKRFFTTKSQVRDYKKLLHFKSLTTIEEKKIFVRNNDFSVNIVSVKDDERGKGVTFYKISPKITFNSCFLQSEISSNFYYSYKTKKVYTKGSKPFLYCDDVTENKIIKLLNLEFISDYLTDTVTHFDKRLYKKILTGKITSKKDFVFWFYKYSIQREVPVKLLFKNFPETKTKTNFLNHLRSYLYVAKNTENFIKFVKEAYIHKPLYRDIKDQAILLGEKIDWSWSVKRLEEKHQKMTEKITKIKLKSIENKKIKFKTDVPNIENIQVISTTQELFEEGEEMKHCVYTNYENEFLRKRSIFLSYNRGVRATAQVNIRDNKPYIYQFLGKRNHTVDAIYHRDLEKVLSNGLGDFIKNELTTNQETVENALDFEFW